MSADDIAPGDLVRCIIQCIIQPDPNVFQPCWAFPPEVGSVWTVEEVFREAFLVATAIPFHPGGLRFVGDSLERPGLWPTPCFRKLCGAPDAAEGIEDLASPYPPSRQDRSPAKESA
jgi:hypothetical protein